MVGLHIKEGGFLSSSSFSFYNSIHTETMKFRIKIITKQSGKITYTPQVKKNFFESWKGLNTGCLSIYISKYAWQVFNSEAEAIEFIDTYKEQEFNKQETVLYKKLDN